VVKLCPRRASRFAAHAASAHAHNDDSKERPPSRDADSFSDKLLAAMRNEFGGHAIKSA